MAERLSASNFQELKVLMDEFDNSILPWCKENGYSLHEAFEICREKDREKYRVLSTLWGTPFGKDYVRSCFYGTTMNVSFKEYITEETKR